MKKADEKEQQPHHHHHHEHHHDHHEHHEHPHEHHEHSHEHHHEHHHHDGHEHGTISLTREQLINELNITDFGWTLWKFGHHLLHENGILSPCSVSIPMSLLQLGSRGNTLRELNSTFKYPAENVIVSGYQELLSSFQPENDNGKEHVCMLTGIFVPSGSTLRKDFTHLAETKFNTLIRTSESSAEHASEATHDQAIEEFTKNKILASTLMNELHHEHASMMVMSSTYFENEWQFKFDKALTTDEPFFNSGGRKVDVPMMKGTRKFPYSDGTAIGAHILGLPYAGERYMMMILLPHKRYGLADVEKRLDTKFLATAYLHLKTETDVSLKLPRFSHRSTVDIHAICDKMGMKSMFQDTADFAGIFEKKNKEKVTKFQQTSLIDVDEDGTGPGAEGAVAQSKKSSTAGASGGTQNSDNSGPETTTNGAVSILVDHPFMYFIVDRKNNIMLLSGIQAKF